MYKELCIQHESYSKDATRGNSFIACLFKKVVNSQMNLLRYTSSIQNDKDNTIGGIENIWYNNAQKDNNANEIKPKEKDNNANGN